MKNEEKKVVVIDQLERGDGEVDFSKLNDGDKFQLLTRYLNDICSITKSMLQITADQYVLIELVCKKLGIDVKAEKQELVKKYKAQMEENIQKSKEALESLAENKA
jgi:uncharacterized FlgJ-related protein